MRGSFWHMELWVITESTVQSESGSVANKKTQLSTFD